MTTMYALTAGGSQSISFSRLASASENPPVQFTAHIMSTSWVMLRSTSRGSGLVRLARRWLALERPTRDDEFIAFPRERPGLNYALNWSLNGDGLTPGGDAYRLTKAKQAEKLLGTTAEAVVGSADAAGEVDEAVFDGALDDMISRLEKAQTLYVAEGDAPQQRLACRVITDDLALAASVMSHIIEQMPLREPTELPVTCFVSGSAPDFAAYDIFDEADKGERVKIVLGGAQATAAKLKASLAVAADKLLEPKEDAADQA